jgi:hypothetical protein
MEGLKQAGRARTALEVSLGLALLFLARGICVASFTDVFGYGEELEKAAVAKALLDGIELPHRALIFHPYEGGGFLVGHLEALAFALVGESFLALKLVALAWSAAILVASMALARRVGGRGAALVCAGLFVLAPLPFQKLSLLALGIHFEALLFLALALRLLIAVAIDGDRRRLTWCALGAVCGLGVWYSLQCLVLTGYVACVLALARRRETFGRLGAWCALAFALGLAPLAYVASYAGAAVFDIHGRSLVEPGSFGERFERLGQFLVAVLTERSPLDLAGALAWMIGPVAATAWLIAKRRPHALRSSSALVSGYLAFFLLAYVASGFAIGRPYHWFLFGRLAPAFLLATVLLAAATSRGIIEGRAGARATWAGLLALLLASGAWDLARDVRSARPESWRENLRIAATTSGYSYEGWLLLAGDDLPGTLEERARALARYREPNPRRLYFELGAGLIAPRSTNLAEALAVARAACGDAWPDVALGFARMWIAGVGKDVGTQLAELERIEDPLLRERLTESCGRLGAGMMVTRESLQQEIDRALELNLPPAWVRGIGWRAFRIRTSAPPDVWHRDRPRPSPLLDREPIEAFLGGQDERVRATLLEGWHGALADRTLR